MDARWGNATANCVEPRAGMKIMAWVGQGAWGQRVGEGPRPRWLMAVLAR